MTPTVATGMGMAPPRFLPKATGILSAWMVTGLNRVLEIWIIVKYFIQVVVTQLLSHLIGLMEDALQTALSNTVTIGDFRLNVIL